MSASADAPPRRRGLRRAIVAVLVLAGLLVAADFGAAALAESQIAHRMRGQLALAEDPTVRINNFPFLWQVATGHYRSIDVTADRLTVGPLEDVTARVQLRDIDAALSDLMASRTSALVAGEIEGTVRVDPKSLEPLMGGFSKVRIDEIDEKFLAEAARESGDSSLRGIDPDRAARIVATTTVLGTKAEVAAIVMLTPPGEGGRVQLVPRDVRLGDPDAPPLPAAEQRKLARVFGVTIDPGQLPLGVVPTKFTASSGALEVSGISTDVQLGSITGVR